jgi:hypothetical protein
MRHVYTYSSFFPTRRSCLIISWRQRHPISPLSDLSVHHLSRNPARKAGGKSRHTFSTQPMICISICITSTLSSDSTFCLEADRRSRLFSRIVSTLNILWYLCDNLSKMLSKGISQSSISAVANFRSASIRHRTIQPISRCVHSGSRSPQSIRAFYVNRAMIGLGLAAAVTIVTLLSPPSPPLADTFLGY